MSELIATYRLQLTKEFGFAEARKLLPYLESLGVSHLYLSPIWQARSGSMHGYDVVDPTVISEDLGGEEQFLELAHAQLGIVLDVVPNHMAADDANPFWNDEQLREKFFDIDMTTGFRRRFFDIDDLVGVRVEDPEVFAVTHQKVKELISIGVVDGLRIDHIDGLADPAMYLNRLAEFGTEHVWVEKILQPGERLRPWPVDGTTGYDFLNDITALFVDPGSKRELTELTGEHRSFGEIAYESKLEQVHTTFTPEVAKLRSIFDMEEVAPGLASLPVYRTYVDPEKAIDDADRPAISALPERIRSAFIDPARVPREFIVRFQQTTPAVMAKGVEDTALYRYVRLLALNEVGGDPSRFGLSVEEFHSMNSRRHRDFPRSMLSSQTHDTKRSGDVRARIIALSYQANEWSRAVQGWHQLTSKWRADGAPDWTEELFIYQTLIGGWPIGMDRLGPYLRKALREAKRNTNWMTPNEQWEERTVEFCAHLSTDPEFLSTFLPLAETIALTGERIALAQLVLRLSSPGIPDIYQGDESWNFSFVDPDNRRAVDWNGSESALSALLSGIEPIQRTNAKLYTTKVMLDLRNRHYEAIAGSYEPLPSSSTTCAFRRGGEIIVAAALRDAPIEFELPPGDWSNILEPLARAYHPAPVAVFRPKRV